MEERGSVGVYVEPQVLPNWHAGVVKERSYRMNPLVALFFVMWVMLAYAVSHRGRVTFSKVVPYADTMP